MRRAVTTLQSVHSLSAASGGIIHIQNVNEMIGLPSKNIISSLVKTLKSNSFEKMEAAVFDIIAEGYSAQLILSVMLQDIILEKDSSLSMNELSRAELSIRMAE